MFEKALTILVTLSLLNAARGSCHTCQSNYAMCHDERRFTMCSEGISPSKMFECPIGSICTGEDEICVQPNAESPLNPTCEASCEVCKAQGSLFACLDETTYAFCFEDDLPNYELVGTCPSGYVCNLDSPTVCIPTGSGYASCYSGSSTGPSTLAPSTEDTPATASSEVTTISTENTPAWTQSPSTPDNSIPTEPNVPSTTQEPRDAVTFCKDQQTEGLFRAEGDLTCKEYFYCYLLSGQYLGVKYICPTSTFFYDETQTCISTRPNNC